MRRLVPALVAAAAACLVPDVSIEGKLCDGDHPCVAGYVCVVGRCQASAPSDAGPTCATDAGRWCDGGRLFVCSAGGQPAIQSACADQGLACHAGQGCLPRCTLSPDGGGCQPPATVCLAGDECCQGECRSGRCTPDAGYVPCDAGCPCRPPGITCSAGTDCCTSLCTGGRCVCLAAGFKCTSRSQCCSGLCINEACAGCTPIGLPCGTATECCSLACRTTDGGGGACQTDAGSTPRCAPGSACDLEVFGCLATVACGVAVGGCTPPRGCHAGACLVPPSSEALVRISAADGGVFTAADMACHVRDAPDPAGPAGYGGLARLRARLATLADAVIIQGVAGTVEVLDGESPDLPTLGLRATFALGADGGMPDSSRPVVLDGFPTNRRVVFRSEGSGFGPTDLYAYVPADRVVQVGAAGNWEVAFDITVADHASIQAIGASAGFVPRPGLSTVVGSAFDCAVPPRRVANAVVATYVPSATRYTEPTLFRIDSSLIATSATGRFVVLDVPITAANQVLTALNAPSIGAGVTVLSGHTFVPRADAVSVVNVRPPKR